MDQPTPPFWLTFITSPGLGGLAVLMAAIIAAFATRGASKRLADSQQQQLGHAKDELQQQIDHSKDMLQHDVLTSRRARCWERFVWLIDTASKPATAVDPPLSPNLAREIVESLYSESCELNDTSLREVIYLYGEGFAANLLRLAGPARPASAAQEEDN